MFAQSRHTALPDSIAHEGSEVCSADYLQVHSEPVEPFTVTAVACRVLSFNTGTADETELLFVPRC